MESVGEELVLGSEAAGASLIQTASGRDKIGLLPLLQRFHRVYICVIYVIGMCVHLLEEQRPKKPPMSLFTSCTCEYICTISYDQR